MNLTSIYDYDIIQDPSMLEDGEPLEVPRTWRERWFTLPWKPWKAAKTITPRVPSPSVSIFGNKLIGHPETIKALLDRSMEIDSTNCKSRYPDSILSSTSYLHNLGY